MAATWGLPTVVDVYADCQSSHSSCRLKIRREIRRYLFPVTRDRELSCGTGSQRDKRQVMCPKLEIHTFSEPETKLAVEEGGS